MLDTAYRLGRLREALLNSSQADLNDWEIEALDDAIKALEKLETRGEELGHLKAQHDREMGRVLKEQAERIEDLKTQRDRAVKMQSGMRRVRDLNNYWRGYKIATNHALKIVQ